MPGVRPGALLGAAVLLTLASAPADAQQQQQGPGYEERLRQGAIFDKTMIGVPTEGSGGPPSA
jgi:hypothetical protein